MKQYLIGIDPGRHNGYAVYNPQSGKLEVLATFEGLTHLFSSLFMQVHNGSGRNEFCFVRVEDARKRGGKPERAQGAGAVKAICREIETMLKDLKARYPDHVDYEFVPPVRGATKMKAETFQKITGWKDRTSQHARDAAMMVWGIGRIMSALKKKEPRSSAIIRKKSSFSH